MGEKSSFIAACLNSTAVSRFFTQDMEEAITHETKPDGNGQKESVKCPLCDGPMWDNREKKTNPKSPDFKCKDKTCKGVYWPGQWDFQKKKKELLELLKHATFNTTREEFIDNIIPKAKSKTELDMIVKRAQEAIDKYEEAGEPHDDYDGSPNYPGSELNHWEPSESNQLQKDFYTKKLSLVKKVLNPNFPAAKRSELQLGIEKAETINQLIDLDLWAEQILSNGGKK
jgi:hypothetical protein